ncbi:MAG TPA: gamma-glutamylcyclotransferase [Cellvibrio sp.]|nr:gamma-glutamylcyclotransferase [Cellvibrio sp.]
MPTDYIFVYGTLRRSCTTGAHQNYLAEAEFIDNAKINGRLYRVSYYPALVLDDAAGWVVGEVYRLTSSEQLIYLDTYEECTHPSRPDQEYQRNKIDVVTESGIELSAWVYSYQRAIEGLELITSGDFLHP